MIYLDHATQTRPRARVIDALLPYYRELWGCVEAPYPFGQRLIPAIEEAKAQIRALVEAPEDVHVVHTHSGAEAVSQVVMGIYKEVSRQAGKNHFVTSRRDRAAPILAMTHLQELGCVMEMAPVNEEGIVTAEALAETLTPRTALVSLSAANGLTGVIQPLEEIAALCKERGVMLHVDATHTVGKGDFPWREGDILTFGGEALGAPSGCGALLMRSHVSLGSLIFGQSADTASAVALGAAAKEAKAVSDYYLTEVARLRDHFERLVQEAIPETQVAFAQADRLPYITALLFPGVASEALLYLLSRKGVYASMGGGTMQQISYHVDAHCALSFALSDETSEEELARAVLMIAECVVHLQRCAL